MVLLYRHVVPEARGNKHRYVHYLHETTEDRQRGMIYDSPLFGEPSTASGAGLG